MPALTPEQEKAAEAELLEQAAFEEKRQSKEDQKAKSQKQRIEDMEMAISQLAQNQNAILQSLQNAQKQQPAQPIPQNTPAPQPAGLDMNSPLLPLIAQILGGQQDKQENIFEQLGKEMVAQFAGAYVKKAAKNMAGAQKGFSHDR